MKNLMVISAVSVAVDVQIAVKDNPVVSVPEYKQIRQWVEAAVGATRLDRGENLLLTVRIVDEDEIIQLNSHYRKKDKVTNVLSFPFSRPPGMPADESISSLGDLVVCASVVEQEAKDQNKTSLAHWAHMIIHGTLHLLGYDHQTEGKANEMEAIEIRLLGEMGFQNPYEQP